MTPYLKSAFDFGTHKSLIYLILLLLLTLICPQAEGANLELTPAEKAWLQNHKTLKVAGPKSFPPFHFFTKDTVNGIAYDYARLIAQNLGITLEYQNNLPWPEVLKKAEDRDIDIIACSAKTSDREKYLLFSKPILSFPLVIISRRDASFIGGLEDLNGKTVSFTKKISTFEWLQRDKIDVNPLFVNSPLDELNAVSLGQAEAAIQNLAGASYLIDKNGLTNLKIAAPTPYGNYQLFMAVRSDWPELVGILNKSLSALDLKEHHEIRQKWIAVRYEHGIRSADIIKWAFIILGGSSLVIAIVLTWNRKLAYEIKERQKAEYSLKKSRERFQHLYQNTPAMLHSINSKGEIIAVSNFWLEKLGYEYNEVIGKKSTDFLTENSRNYARDIGLPNFFKNGFCNNIPYQFLTKNGETRDILLSAFTDQDDQGEVIQANAVLIDITDQKRIEEDKNKLESQLRQAHKMEAIGTLAGGIAHDFNNILTAILGYAELAHLKLKNRNDPVKHNLLEVIKAGARAKELVKQILAFSRKSSQEKQPVQIQLIIQEVLKLLRATIPTTINIRHTIIPDCSAILADPIQIHQVLMNLCTNAAQAMDETGGELSILLDSVEVSENDQNHDASSPSPGKYVKLTIMDTGHGIDQINMESIFDPYFTTKEIGNGSGMGLAVVHGIVKSHGGFISVENKAGEGTAFHVFFPVTSIEQGTIAYENEVLPSGNENILVIDDEETITLITKKMLEEQSYNVVAKTDSTEALKEFSTRPDYFDLIITDQTMPGLTGSDLAKNILAIRPNIPIILCTGFSTQINMKKAHEIGIKAFLMKPVSSSELTHTIRNLLDGNQQPWHGSASNPAPTCLAETQQ